MRSKSLNLCFWHETNVTALAVNDFVYRLFRDLVEKGVLDQTFSEYWVGKDMDWRWIEDGRFGRFDKTSTTDYYPNSHGIASSLTTYTFFYSQYHQVLLDVASFLDQNTALNNTKLLNRIYWTLERVRNDFSFQYDRCLKLHPHPKIYYERGMLRMHAGQTEDALADLKLLMEMANSDQYKNEHLLTSEMYCQEGEAYADLGQYDKAISSLTEAINRDPNNKDAYFQRAGAYFETGDFDRALSDFIALDIKRPPRPSRLPLEFETALTIGLLKGSSEAAIDFVPSLCSSTYGLGTALWACAKEPVSSYQRFVESCWEITDSIKTYCQTADWETVEGYSEQIRNLYKGYNNLTDQEKGELIGYTIGRYGVDIFIGSTAIKAVGSYKKLRDANRLCNLEAMVAPSTKDRTLAEAITHARAREKYFENIQIQWDKQNKHIPGKHNFDPNRGRIKISQSRLEELVKQNAGKGQRLNSKQPLSPGYHERVDFNEIIGEYALKVEGKPTEFFPTTNGVLHYCKNGVHVVPSNPNAVIKK